MQSWPLFHFQEWGSWLIWNENARFIRTSVILIAFTFTFLPRFLRSQPSKKKLNDVLGDKKAELRKQIQNLQKEWEEDLRRQLSLMDPEERMVFERDMEKDWQQQRARYSKGSEKAAVPETKEEIIMRTIFKNEGKIRDLK